MTCKAQRRGNDMYCALCLKTWDFDDPEPPVCPEKDKFRPRNYNPVPVTDEPKKCQKTRKYNDIFNRRTFNPII